MHFIFLNNHFLIIFVYTVNTKLKQNITINIELCFNIHNDFHITMYIIKAYVKNKKPYIIICHNII